MLIDMSIVFNRMFLVTLDDVENAWTRVNTVKYLVNQYQVYFASNVNIVVIVSVLCSYLHVQIDRMRRIVSIH
jgi:hypothetical protein